MLQKKQKLKEKKSYSNKSKRRRFSFPFLSSFLPRVIFHSTRESLDSFIRRSRRPLAEICCLHYLILAIKISAPRTRLWKIYRKFSSLGIPSFWSKLRRWQFAASLSLVRNRDKTGQRKEYTVSCGNLRSGNLI